MFLVMHYMYVGAGHSWPGSHSATLCPGSGPFACNFDVDATTEMMRFFKRYQLPDAAAADNTDTDFMLEFTKRL